MLRLGIPVAAAALLLDQLSKWWILAAFAFVFAGIALVIVGGLLVWLKRLDRAWPAVAIGLIVGGAIGNVIDRLRFGAVVDFLYFHGDAYPGVCRVLGGIGLGWLECRWPAFNVADTVI